MENKKYSLKQLKEISDSTGFSLADLQQQYGVYEFKFKTIEEASVGFYKISQRYKDNEKHPELLAYVDAWKNKTSTTYRTLNKHSLEHAICFTNNCYPDEANLSKGLELLKKLIVGDAKNFARVIKEVKYNRQHIEYDKCIVYQYLKTVEETFDRYFVDKLRGKFTEPEIDEVWLEFQSFEINHWSKFPEFKDLLSRKFVNAVDTCEKLLLIPNVVSEKYVIQKWLYLVRILPFDEILPTVGKFLSKLHQSDQERWKRPNIVQRKVAQFLELCKTETQVRSLVETSRHFFYQNDEEQKMYSDGYFKLWHGRVEGIVAGLNQRPKLVDFPKLAEVFRHNKYELGIINDKWRTKSVDAFKKPIPDFYKLYSQIHESKKEELLKVWNLWGFEQLHNVDTWEELREFDYHLLPIPGEKHTIYNIYSSSRCAYQSFIVFLTKIINVVPIDHQHRVVELINKMDKYLSAYGTSGLFNEEMIKIVKVQVKRFAESSDRLWNLYESHKNNSNYVHDNLANVLEIIIDPLLNEASGYFNQIFEYVKSNERLKRKYTDWKIATTIKLNYY